jgi:hypothetical protein
LAKKWAIKFEFPKIFSREREKFRKTRKIFKFSKLNRQNFIKSRKNFMGEKIQKKHLQKMTSNFCRIVKKD